MADADRHETAVVEPTAPDEDSASLAPPRLRWAPPGLLPRGVRPRTWGEFVRTVVLSRLGALIVLIVGFALIVNAITPKFLTVGNIRVMIVGSGMEFVLAGVMALLLVARMFDLSIDGVVNMCGVITGLLLVHHHAIWLAVIAGLGAGAVVGLANGFAVTKMRMNPLMTTLGTWWLAQGIAYGLTLGVSPNAFPNAFDQLGAGHPLGIDMPVWFMIVCLPLLAWTLGRTRFGYHVYATGGNPEAARLRGIHIDRVVIITFVLIAVAAAVTGIVYAARLDSATATAVNGLNLRVIAGAVIGGCSLYGGKGSVLGAVLGLLFMAMLANATVVLGINPYWQYSILGGVILGAVALDALASRREAR
jgi:ribose transport system permease protein